MRALTTLLSFAALMIVTVVTFVTVSMLPLAARADIVQRDAIDVSHGLDDWTQDILAATEKYEPSSSAKDTVVEPASGYTECAPIKEIQNTILCASYRQNTMNQIFARATYYVEQSSTILRLDDLKYVKLSSQMGGHDLHASDLHRFYLELLDACEQSNHDPALCPTAAEQETFEQFLLPKFADGSDFVVIAFSVLSDADFDTVVSHEIMHAQYFNDEHYHQIADEFWAKQVTQPDQTKVRTILTPMYDPTNDELMRNEFQAYILMANANRNMLSRLVPKYRQPFLNSMKEGGVVPIQVE